MEGERPKPQGLTREQLIQELRLMKVNQTRKYALAWQINPRGTELFDLNREMQSRYNKSFSFDIDGLILTATRAK